MYPYNYHFKQLENIEKQLSLDDESKKIIWKEIVKAKNNLISAFEMLKNSVAY